MLRSRDLCSFSSQLIQRRPPHAASAHASFAGGEPKEMACVFFVLHRCILLTHSHQSRWRAQRARPHERAHAPPARADTHTRQTPASMQRAVRRRGPRLNLRRHCVHATNYLLCYGHRPDKPWEATVQPCRKPGGCHASVPFTVTIAVASHILLPPAGLTQVRPTHDLHMTLWP